MLQKHMDHQLVTFTLVFLKTKVYSLPNYAWYEQLWDKYISIASGKHMALTYFCLSSKTNHTKIKRYISLPPSSAKNLVCMDMTFQGTAVFFVRTEVFLNVHLTAGKGITENSFIWLLATSGVAHTRLCWFTGKMTYDAGNKWEHYTEHIMHKRAINVFTGINLWCRFRCWTET